MQFFQYSVIHRVGNPLVLALLTALAACSPHSSQQETKAASAPTTASTPVTEPAPASSAPVQKDSQERGEDGQDPEKFVQAEKPEAGQGRGPRVKGVRIGDSMTQARSAVAALANGLPPNERCRITDDIISYEGDSAFGIRCGTQDQAWLIFKGGRLLRFKFSPYLVSLVFGSMPFKEFAQTFIDAYHIPRLDPMANMGGQYLGYKDDAQGWMVFVYPNNSFAVETAQTEAQRAKHFN
ncbi:hypothetical protein N5J06_19945 [Ralstonia sp. CHL-2022]|uniref:Lipoprotein n=1 Tax=Ralstonia mojiangensis TaxID=2953895 RepID=A0ABT2LDG0_9RALS|nr:hypothetical protein [Ralstonia mojiangensis]MCT7313252.1 hypothetical protein [Ralstonia mojiangensis]